MSALKQVELVEDPEPSQVTVNGAGLLAWGERAKAGEVHIYRMITKSPAHYVLSLIWLKGRKTYNFNESPAAVAEGVRTAPLRGKTKANAVQMGLGGFA